MADRNLGFFGHKKGVLVSFLKIVVDVVAQGIEGCQKCNFVTDFEDTYFRKKCVKGGEKLYNKEKRRLRTCLNRHPELYEEEWNYTQFVKTLGLTRYSDKEKRDRQLASLGEYINFEVLDNGKIQLLTNDMVRNREREVERDNESENGEKDGRDGRDGREDKSEFKNIKAFYNDNRGKAPRIEFRNIMRTSMMGLIKERLYHSGDIVFRCGYDEIGRELGFCNELYKMVRRNYIKASRIINGIGGRPKKVLSRQTKRAIDSIGNSYVGYINRTLEGLERDGYIEYTTGFWGYKWDEYSRGKVLVPLNNEEEMFCAVEGCEIVCRDMGLENYGKVRQLNRESEYYERLGELMLDRYGLSYVRKLIEIVLTDKGREVLRDIKWGEAERKWLNKQFLSGLKENSERYYKEHREEKGDEGNYNLMLEVLSRREMRGDREELKTIRKRLYESLGK